ncbi:MAG: hypothetical protein L6416_06520 [Candidatus Omnitrophica bacterium]|nr:hypothetical protein [Candidatus Omnitrophota bacterium]
MVLSNNKEAVLAVARKEKIPHRQGTGQRGRRMIVSSLGNTELLNLRKAAFLCSREIPASVALKCYDWAIEQCNQGNCVISGFHSKIENLIYG